MNRQNSGKQPGRAVFACLLAAMLVTALPAAGQESAAARDSAPAGDTDPYRQPDNSWITISGEVESVSADSFIMDYGDGLLTVEMDDGDRDADAYKLSAGDKVTVNGVVDADFYERTTIEASSVFVEKLNTHFYASTLDEEDGEETAHAPAWYKRPNVPGEVVMQGTVSDVDYAENEFTLDRGDRKITVELEFVEINLLDAEGYQRIQEGDRVRVEGIIDNELFERRVLNATSVTSLAD